MEVPQKGHMYTTIIIILWVPAEYLCLTVLIRFFLSIGVMKSRPAISSVVLLIIAQV